MTGGEGREMIWEIARGTHGDIGDVASLYQEYKKYAEVISSEIPSFAGENWIYSQKCISCQVMERISTKGHCKQCEIRLSLIPKGASEIECFNQMLETFTSATTPTIFRPGQLEIIRSFRKGIYYGILFITTVD